MPITYRIVADSADELPEALRTKAKQDGGKFVIDALPDGFAVEDVQGLKRTLQTLRSESKQHADAVKAFVDAGLTVEGAREAAEALGAMRAGKLKSPAELDAFKATLEKKLADQTEAMSKRLARRTSEASKLMVDGELTKLLVAAGADPEAMDFLLDRTKKNIRVEEDNEGNLRSFVVGDDGKTPAITKKSGMGPMGYGEVIDQLREAPGTKRFFKTQVAGGAGSTSQTAGRGQPGQQTEDLSRLSPAELISRGNRASA